MSKRVSDKELIRVLRCISTAGGPESCEGCRYRTVEDLNGEPYESCDTDAVCLDAANRLEELTALADAAEDTDSADCKACKQSRPWCGGCCNTCSDPCNASQGCRRR